MPKKPLEKNMPSYKTPPVNEVVCGLRFHTPDKLGIPHVGLLWDKFRRDYPIIQHAHQVATIKGEMPIDKATGLPLQRVWFINEKDDQLIQFQFDRFHFNWRRREAAYPRYHHIIGNFENLMNTITQLFLEFNLGELKPIEYELSYINHIPKGEGWTTAEDLADVFKDFVWNQINNRFLPSPTNIAWQAQFSLPEETGRLFINLKPAIRTNDKLPLLVLDLTVQSSGDSADMKTVREWFDTAHEWIVRGFADITTDEIQEKYWGRENA